ncbi:hypothetical protein D3C87_1029280 [compost metagenome]
MEFGPCIQIIHRAAISQCLGQGLHWCFPQVIEQVFAQAGNQHSVLLTQALGGRQQFFIDLIAQIGDQHHQSPAFLPCQQLRGGGLIVGGALAAVEVINAVEQGVELPGAFHRREVVRCVAGKRTETDRVALAQGDITQQQAGIERVIEVRKLVILTAHAATAVEHEDDLLVALVLILPGYRCALPSSGLPVDLAQAVALAKFAQLMKLQPQATALSLAHAELAQPVIHSQ